MNKRQFKVQGSTLNVAHCTQRSGFTLIEVLVAMAIFAIAVLGLAIGTTSVMRANQNGLYTTIATNLAQDKLEELKAKTPSSIASGGPENQTVSGVPVTFTRSWTVTSGQPATGVKQIDVTVTWTDYMSRTLTVSSAVKE